MCWQLDPVCEHHMGPGLAERGPLSLFTADGEEVGSRSKRSVLECHHSLSGKSANRVAGFEEVGGSGDSKVPSEIATSIFPMSALVGHPCGLERSTLRRKVPIAN